MSFTVVFDKLDDQEREMYHCGYRKYGCGMKSSSSYDKIEKHMTKYCHIPMFIKDGYCPNRTQRCWEKIDGNLDEHWKTCATKIRKCENPKCEFTGNLSSFKYHFCSNKFCKHYSAGCTFRSYESDIMEKHEQECKCGCCKYELMGCKFRGISDDLKKHEEKCQYGPTECKLCKNFYSINQISNHLLECPESEKQCDLCFKSVKRWQIESHYLNCKDECLNSNAYKEIPNNPLRVLLLNKGEQLRKNRPNFWNCDESNLLICASDNEKINSVANYYAIFNHFLQTCFLTITKI